MTDGPNDKRSPDRLKYGAPQTGNYYEFTTVLVFGTSNPRPNRAKSYKIKTLPLVGPVAQRLEQRTHNPLVLGSNPSGPTSCFRTGHTGDLCLRPLILIHCQREMNV